MCIKPWYRTDIGKTIPCGGCIACRADKQKLWTERIRTESQGKRCTFLTLTYDEKHVPYGADGITQTLKKKQLTNWLDNIKHQLKNIKLPAGNTAKFKYLAVGEYGGIFQRPHYHILIIGLDFHEMDRKFQELWKNGITKALPITDGRINYVTKYMMKSQNGALAEEQYDKKGIERPFLLAAQKLGTEYMLKHKDEINKTGYIKSGTRKIQIPSYFKNILQSYDMDSVQAREEQKRKDAKERDEKAIKEKYRNWNAMQKDRRQAREASAIKKMQQNHEAYDEAYYVGSEKAYEDILSTYKETKKDDL